jgi:hypothetical protein
VGFTGIRVCVKQRPDPILVKPTSKVLLCVKCGLISKRYILVIPKGYHRTYFNKEECFEKWVRPYSKVGICICMENEILYMGCKTKRNFLICCRAFRSHKEIISSYLHNAHLLENNKSTTNVPEPNLLA